MTKFKYIVHCPNGAEFYESGLYDRLPAVTMLNRLVRLGCYLAIRVF